MVTDTGGFPVLTFHFAKGAELALGPKAIFMQKEPHIFCMEIISIQSIAGDGMMDLSILGVMAQQNYNGGFDINENRLYLQSIDCERLVC